MLCLCINIHRKGYLQSSTPQVTSCRTKLDDIQHKSKTGSRPLALEELPKESDCRRFLHEGVEKEGHTRLTSVPLAIHHLNSGRDTQQDFGQEDVALHFPQHALSLPKITFSFENLLLFLFIYYFNMDSYLIFFWFIFIYKVLEIHLWACSTA